MRITIVIRSRRMRWAAHAVRMGRTRNAYKILVGTPERKRLLGRLCYKWEDNIKKGMLKTWVCGHRLVSTLFVKCYETSSAVCEECARSGLRAARQQFKLRNISSAAFLPNCERGRETDRQTAVALLARVEHLALSPWHCVLSCHRSVTRSHDLDAMLCLRRAQSLWKTDSRSLSQEISSLL